MDPHHPFLYLTATYHLHHPSFESLPTHVLDPSPVLITEKIPPPIRSLVFGPIGFTSATLSFYLLNYTNELDKRIC